MNVFDVPDVSQRAGVDASYVERLIDLGLLVPDRAGRLGEGDVRRVTLLQALDRAGVPVDGIAEARRLGHLSLSFADTPSYSRFAELTSETFADVSARTQIPIELLIVVRRAMGRPLPTPDDRVREDELAVVPLVELQVHRGFRQAAIERWLQVYGDSVRRIAETEEDYFASEVIAPLIESGMSPAQALQASHEVSPRLAELAEQALRSMYHAHQARSWTRGIVEVIEGALEEAGLHSRLERQPAVCFLDISGFTRLTEERGDQAAADLADRLAMLVHGISSRYGGLPIKWLGDGVMFTFPDAGASVVAALEMVDSTEPAGLPPAHVGLHAGPVLFQEGDYFGRTVNLAARIADVAGPGEVLVTQAIVDAAGSGRKVTFSERAPIDLQGIGPVGLFEAHRSG